MKEATEKLLLAEKQIQELKFKVELPLRSLEDAIKTIRKTGMYGFATAINVEWPTVNDLLQMVKNIPIKIINLKYMISTVNSNHFGAF
jgi:hypothetical protein